MSRLARGGTAKPVSRDQILRRERGQKKIIVFPIQLTTGRIGNHERLIHALRKVLTIHTHTHTHTRHTFDRDDVLCRRGSIGEVSIVRRLSTSTYSRGPARETLSESGDVDSSGLETYGLSTSGTVRLERCLAKATLVLWWHSPSMCDTDSRSPLDVIIKREPVFRGWDREAHPSPYSLEGKNYVPGIFCFVLL